ncbi:hypothetical protein AMTRI_Chr01g111480 [Amborella trichopoda]
MFSISLLMFSLSRLVTLKTPLFFFLPTFSQRGRWWWRRAGSGTADGGGGLAVVLEEVLVAVGRERGVWEV